jgi:hypothetical protein
VKPEDILFVFLSAVQTGWHHLPPYVRRVVTELVNKLPALANLELRAVSGAGTQSLATIISGLALETPVVRLPKSGETPKKYQALKLAIPHWLDHHFNPRPNTAAVCSEKEPVSVQAGRKRARDSLLIAREQRGELNAIHHSLGTEAPPPMPGVGSNPLLGFFSVTHAAPQSEIHPDRPLLPADVESQNTMYAEMEGMESTNAQLGQDQDPTAAAEEWMGWLTGNYHS